MRRFGFLPLALAAVVAVGCDNNRRDTPAATTADPAAVGTAGEADRNKPGLGDKDFVNDAAIAGMAEVELGRMASEKGASANVKKFGKMMVEDHTKDIGKYEKQASSGDADTAALAQKTLPTLRKHLEAAKSL